MCGKSCELVKAKIEDTLLMVCKKCSFLGTEIETENSVSSARQSKPMVITEIIPDFAKKIKAARESSKQSKEQLSQKIGISAVVLTRIEKGMRPQDAVTKKLEKELGIALFYTETVTITAAQKTPEVTLGDVVELRLKHRA